MMLKLAYELGYYEYKNSKNKFGKLEAQRRYQAISALINEVGAMIGGWINTNKL